MTQEALKLALEALYPIAHNTTDDPRGQAYKAITAIEEALAQTQEPVAWGVDWGRNGDIPCASIIKRLPNDVIEVEYAPYSYTTPPQRTWVGLTDEMIWEFAEQYGAQIGDTFDYVGYTKVIEAKLRENT